MSIKTENQPTAVHNFPRFEGLKLLHAEQDSPFGDLRHEQSASYSIMSGSPTRSASPRAFRRSAMWSTSTSMLPSRRASVDHLDAFMSPSAMLSPSASIDNLNITTYLPSPPRELAEPDTQPFSACATIPKIVFPAISTAAAEENEQSEDSIVCEAAAVSMMIPTAESASSSSDDATSAIASEPAAAAAAEPPVAAMPPAGELAYSTTISGKLEYVTVAEVRNEMANAPYKKSVFMPNGALMAWTGRNLLRALKPAVKALAALSALEMANLPVACGRVGKAWLDGIMAFPASPEGADCENWLQRWAPLVMMPTEEGKPDRRVWRPAFDMADASTRGITVNALTGWQWWSTQAVVHTTIFAASIWHGVQHVCNFGRFKPSDPTPADNYKAIVNMCFACWYQPTHTHADGSEDTSRGAFVFYDTDVIWKQETTVRVRKTEYFCDNTAGTVTRLVMHFAASEELRMDAYTVEMHDPLLISMMILHYAQFVSHGQVHWWANGVCRLKKQWPLAEWSSRWVGAFNYGACLVAPFCAYTPHHVFQQALGHNLLQGFPMHHHLPESVLQHSTLHKINRDSKRELQEHFESIGQPMSIADVNILTCATVMHAGDHYYGSKYLATQAVNPVLQIDYTCAALSITAPVDYPLLKFKVTDFPRDAVCQILHRCAERHDPEFANTMLTVGIAI